MYIYTKYSYKGKSIQVCIYTQNTFMKVNIYKYVYIY